MRCPESRGSPTLAQEMQRRPTCTRYGEMTHIPDHDLFVDAWLWGFRLTCDVDLATVKGAARNRGLHACWKAKVAWRQENWCDE